MNKTEPRPHVAEIVDRSEENEPTAAEIAEILRTLAPELIVCLLPELIRLSLLDIFKPIFLRGGARALDVPVDRLDCYPCRVEYSERQLIIRTPADVKFFHDDTESSSVCVCAAATESKTPTN
jgi:hypothetical protein